MQILDRPDKENLLQTITLHQLPTIISIPIG